MMVLNLPFKALMFITLMRPSLVLFLVLWLKLVKDFLKVRCRLALLPFLISCLIWLDLVASLPLIKERILVIILLLHFLSLRLGSVLVLFFFQAEDGIRDRNVTGVQTCALPISPARCAAPTVAVFGLALLAAACSNSTGLPAPIIPNVVDSSVSLYALFGTPISSPS